MVDLACYRARIGRFVSRGARLKNKMDPYRAKHRLSRLGELIVCLTLLIAWGTLIQACLLHDGHSRTPRHGKNTAGLLKFTEKRPFSLPTWHERWTMTSPPHSTMRGKGGKIGVDIMFRGKPLASASSFTHFAFDTLAADGDVHPHPGPFTPTTTTTTFTPVPQTPSTVSQHSSHGTVFTDTQTSTSRSSTFSNLPPAVGPRTRSRSRATTPFPSTRTSGFPNHPTYPEESMDSSSREEMETVDSQHPIGGYATGGLTSLDESQDSPEVSGSQTRNNNNQGEPTMDSDFSVLPSQIPSTEDNQHVFMDGSEDSFVSSGLAPQTSTQIDRRKSSSSSLSGDDREYGEEGATAYAPPTPPPPVDITYEGSTINPSPDGVDTATLASTVASTSAEDDLPAGLSLNSAGHDTIIHTELEGEEEQSADLFHVSASSSQFSCGMKESDSHAGAASKESTDTLAEKSDAYLTEEQVWRDASVLSDINSQSKCDDEFVHEVREGSSDLAPGMNESMNVTRVTQHSTSTTYTDTREGHNDKHQHSMSVNPKGVPPDQAQQIHTYSRPPTTNSNDKVDDTKTQTVTVGTETENNNICPEENPTASSTSSDAHDKKGLLEMKGQMDLIIQQLTMVSSQLSSNQADIKQNQQQTQQALETNKQEAQKAAQKTQTVIDNIHQDIKKNHQEIQANQEQTQQAFLTTNTKLADVTDQVTATLESLQSVQKEINDTRSDVELNKKDLQDTRSELQKNQDDIQKLKNEVDELKARQNELDEQQAKQEDYNIWNDKQKDRQEILNRRSNILFYGIPEKKGRGRERSDEVVIAFLNDYIPEGEWKDSDCVNAYRAGRWGGGERARPRPIVATFDKPSDVGFILKNKQARENMKKDGFGCGQDLTRQQKQTLDNIRSEGKTAYYTRGRLVVRDPVHDIRSRSRQENDERHRHRQHIKIALADGTDIDMEIDPGDDTETRPQDSNQPQQQVDGSRQQDTNTATRGRDENNPVTIDDPENTTNQRSHHQYQQQGQSWNQSSDRRDRLDRPVRSGARPKSYQPHNQNQNYRYSRRDTPTTSQQFPPFQPLYSSDQSSRRNNPTPTSNTTFFPQAPSFAQFQQMQNFFAHLNEFASQHQHQHANPPRQPNGPTQSKTPNVPPPPPQPPPPPPPKNGGGGDGRGRGVWNDSTRTRRANMGLMNDRSNNLSSRGGHAWVKLGTGLQAGMMRRSNVVDHSNPDQASEATGNYHKNKKSTGSDKTSDPKPAQNANEGETERESEGGEEGSCEEEEGDESESGKRDERVRVERNQRLMANNVKGAKGANVSVPLSGNKNMNASDKERCVSERGTSNSDDACHVVTNVDDSIAKPTHVSTRNSHTPPLAQQTPSAQLDREQEETEVYEDARENRDDSDTPVIIDEYIELKTPGAKVLESLTPKPMARRRKKKDQRLQTPVGQMLGSDTNPVVVNDSQPSNQSNNSDVRSSDPGDLHTPSNSASTANAKNSCTALLGSEPPAKASSSHTRPRVEENPTEAGHDVTAANQSEEAFQAMVDRVNLVTAARESQAADSKVNESMSQSATPSNKRIQTTLTAGGALCRATDDSDASESARNTKGKGKGKGKSSKPKSKANQSTSHLRSNTAGK